MYVCTSITGVTFFAWWDYTKIAPLLPPLKNISAASPMFWCLFTMMAFNKIDRPDIDVWVVACVFILFNWCLIMIRTRKQWSCSNRGSEGKFDYTRWGYKAKNAFLQLWDQKSIRIINKGRFNGGGETVCHEKRFLSHGQDSCNPNDYSVYDCQKCTRVCHLYIKTPKFKLNGYQAQECNWLWECVVWVCKSPF